jgi:hypothetical protein
MLASPPPITCKHWLAVRVSRRIGAHHRWDDIGLAGQPVGRQRRAHPYHESCSHRCADQRLCRSSATVDRQVMCSATAGMDRRPSAATRPAAGVPERWTRPRPAGASPAVAARRACLRRARRCKDQIASKRGRRPTAKDVNVDPPGVYAGLGLPNRDTPKPSVGSAPYLSSTDVVLPRRGRNTRRPRRGS